MKRSLLLTFMMVAFGWHISKAALPDGSAAADWTLTDLNNVTYTLSDYLNNDIPVIIDFSATWCPPCWNYHNNGPLKTLYNTYGPNGTNEMMVFFIEPDGSTNTDCLYGLSTCVGGTTGDWVTGTPYPIIDLIGPTLSVATDYNITYYPTLYGISPDARTWEVGQASQATWENWLLQSFKLEATANITNSVCGDNGAISLTTTGGYGGKNYTWSHGASGANVSNLSPGLYSVTISDANGYYIERDYLVGGSASGAPLDMNVVWLYNVDCNGNATGSAEVEGIDGNYNYSYNWSNGSTSATANNLAADTYFVTITDGAGCTDEFNVQITEPDPLSSVPVTTDDACGNGNGEALMIPFGGTPPFSYDIGNGPEQTDIFFDLPAGFYPYIQYDANGCTFTNDFTINVTGVPTAMAAANSDLDCINTTTTVTGTGSSAGSGYSYLWTTTNGNITSNPNQLDITVDAPGDYQLEVTNTTHGCSEVAMATVVETISAPNANAGTSNPLTCSIPSTLLDGSGSDQGANYTYSWTTTDGNIVGGGDGLTPEIDATGTYTLQVTNTDNGCTATSDVVVGGDFAQPGITVSDGELTCASTTVNICATVDPSVSVVWSTPNGDVVNNCITVDAAGTYNATATGTNGCTNVATSTVTQSADIPQTTINAPSPITCAIPQIMITGTLNGDVAQHTITWTTTNGNIVSGENTLTPTVDAAGSYTMTAVNNDNGCSSAVTTTVTSEAALPVAGFSSSGLIGSITLTNSSSNTTGEATWDLGNGETATGNEVMVSYPSTGIYTVCVTVNNDCGPKTHCQDVQFVTVMTQESSLSNVNCFGENNGSISVTPEGGLTPYEITWTGPNGYSSTDLTINDLAAGDYTMELNDAAGNTINQTMTITEPDLLSGKGEATDATCFGEFGSVMIDITGGIQPYNVDLGSISNPSEVPAGSYKVTVVDDNNCSTEFEFDVNQPDEIINNSTEVVASNAGQNNGSITIEPQGGTGTINVSWNNGMTGTFISGLASGSYIATLTDDNGCERVLEPIVVDEISSIRNLDFVSHFSLSPNPAFNNIQIDVELRDISSPVLMIQNSIGQVVYEQEYKSVDSISKSLDVTSFDGGVYILRVISGQKQASDKFIIIK